MPDMHLHERTLCLVGCGKMGGAILKGWLDNKVVASKNLFVQEKHPSDDLLAMQKACEFQLNAEEKPDLFDTVVLAVKPQIMEQVLKNPDQVKGRLYISVAAGLTLSFYENILGSETPIGRIMPNTPISVGKGVSALIANAACNEEMKTYVRSLFEVSGIIVELETEKQMDAVTAMSGSGPAYVFALIEAFAAAGEAEGLAPDLAMTLARHTVCGAGELAYQSSLSATELREMVTSPNGTTAAGLAVLRSEEGIEPLLKKTVAAAAQRSREMN
jgi:pyrroline-5-carboxylate reductase